MIVAAVLTLNEATNIERCLASLSGFDKRVVLDSGSSDNTVALAESAGATVISHRQTGAFDIAAQRNILLDSAEVNDGDWVVFLDADEEVGPNLMRRIRDAADSGFDAFELTPRYLFEGAWMRRSMNFPNWHPRMTRVGMGPRFEGHVWEHFEEGFRVGRIEEPYEHYGNSKGFSDWLHRHDRYSTWDAETINAYHRTGELSAFKTSRKLGLRSLAARFWPLRPFVRFFVMYVVRGGFLDGLPALRFCLRYAVYEYMTVEKIIEGRRIAAHEPL